MYNFVYLYFNQDHYIYTIGSLKKYIHMFYSLHQITKSRALQNSLKSQKLILYLKVKNSVKFNIMYIISIKS